MKTSILSLFFIFYFIFGSNGQNFVLKGKITNPIINSVEINISSCANEIEIKTIPLDSNNEFEFKTTLPDVSYLNFYHVDNSNSSSIMRYKIIEPNDEIIMTFDAKNFWNSVKFEGNGANKFNYYKEDYIEMNLKKDWEKQALVHEKQPIKMYFNYLDSALEEKLNVLRKYKNKVSPIVYKMCDADVRALVNQKRFVGLYEPSTKIFMPIQSIPYELQQTFFKDLPNQSDTTAKTQFYFQYITSLTYTYFSELGLLTKSVIPIKQQSIILQNQVYFHPSFAERMSSDIIKNSLELHGVNPDYQRKFAEFIQIYPNSPIVKQIQKLEEAKKHFIVGKPAKPFKILDSNGNEVKLEDFKGKVVYLDFWASWCRPCVFDMEYIKNVKEQLKNTQNIIFLYVSVDSDEKNWKEAIKKYEISGVHSRTPEESGNPILEDYAIKGIPSYFIIGKDGNFHTIQPIRPSIGEGKSLVEKLKEAIAENY